MQLHYITRRFENKLCNNFGQHGKEEERERLNKEANEEESKREKREVEGEWERVEIKTLCLDRLSCEVIDVLCSDSEWQSVGFRWVLRCACVLVVLPSVLVVTVPFTNVNVVCEVGFSDSDCEFVDTQTFPLFRKREVSVALEGETEKKKVRLSERCQEQAGARSRRESRRSKRHHGVSKAVHRRHQKGRPWSRHRRRLVQRGIGQQRWTKWKWNMRIRRGLLVNELSLPK